ncbi:MAG: relaxase domain-containing protein [Acidimicrobiales bacterium]
MSTCNCPAVELRRCPCRRRESTGSSTQLSRVADSCAHVADEDISAQVQSAHDEAVGAALAFLQDHAAFTRRGRAGVIQVDTDGYVAAAFTHRTSRARDPQLHTHVLVASKVRASTDGAWLALDGRELYQCKTKGGRAFVQGGPSTGDDRPPRSPVGSDRQGRRR